MDAIASPWLAIGLIILGTLVLIPVAMLSLRGMREGREVELGIKIPTFSLNWRVSPREIPETPTPPQGLGSDGHVQLQRERVNESS
jgi:hypothetical protein